MTPGAHGGGRERFLTRRCFARAGVRCAPVCAARRQSRRRRHDRCSSAMSVGARRTPGTTRHCNDLPNMVCKMSACHLPMDWLN